MEVIKNKLTTLLYGIDGQEGIDVKFHNNPDELQLQQSQIDYFLFNSFEDFIDTVKHQINNLYEGDSDEDLEEDDEEEDLEEPVVYRCLRKAILRTGPGIASSKCEKSLQPGDLIEVLEKKTLNVNGLEIERVRCIMGWCSIESSAGFKLLEEAEGETPTIIDSDSDSDSDDEEEDIDNILWFIDSYVNIKDKLWFDWLSEMGKTNKVLIEDNEKLREENLMLKEQYDLKKEHIELQYQKENNRLFRQEKEHHFKETQRKVSRQKKAYPRKNCWKCRGSINGICVEHGG
tara:strand:+ start:745 stop:1611 length:867 start_codon:yes stop_codon:yes gene_type:complete